MQTFHILVPLRIEASCIESYQIPLILTVLLYIAFKHGLSYGISLYQVMMTLQFLNDVANDAESTQKIGKYVIIASLKCETISKLINRIPGLRLLISSLLGSAFRMHVETLSKPPDVNTRSRSLAL